MVLLHFALQNSQQLSDIRIELRRKGSVGEVSIEFIQNENGPHITGESFQTFIGTKNYAVNTSRLALVNLLQRLQGGEILVHSHSESILLHVTFPLHSAEDEHSKSLLGRVHSGELFLPDAWTMLIARSEEDEIFPIEKTIEAWGIRAIPVANLGKIKESLAVQVPPRILYLNAFYENFNIYLLLRHLSDSLWTQGLSLILDGSCSVGEYELRVERFYPTTLYFSALISDIQHFLGASPVQSPLRVGIITSNAQLANPLEIIISNENYETTGYRSIEEFSTKVLSYRVPDLIIIDAFLFNTETMRMLKQALALADGQSVRKLLILNAFEPQLQPRIATIEASTTLQSSEGQEWLERVLLSKKYGKKKIP